MNQTIEHLSAKRIEALWSEIEPLLVQVEQSSASAPRPANTELIRLMALNGGCHILGFFTSGKLDMVLAFEFTVANSVKTASILAVAGKDLSKFKIKFWPDILAWFKAAGARAVDAFAEPRLAKIYLGKFGFTEQCSYVRMAL